jgi:hypothetical protein
MDSSLFQKQERFKDSTPTAIDLFKEMHCSRKRDFSEQVKQAIVSSESCDFCRLFTSMCLR